MNINETAIINLKITSGEAKDELEALKIRAGELREGMKELEKAGQKGSDEWKAMRVALSEVNTEQKQYVSQMDIADMKVSELKATQKLLNREIQDTVKGTAEYIEKSKRLQEVNTALKEVRDDTRAIGKELDDNKGAIGRFKDAFQGAFAALSLENLVESVVDFGRESIASAAKMSDAMSDIEKSTSMTTEEVSGLVSEIGKIDSRTSTEALLDIAKVAGQLGIAKEEVIGFTKSVDMAVVALGDEFSGGAEEVAGKMGTLKTLFKDTKDLQAGEAINKIGSAINELGAAGSATGPVIADFTARMGQLGDLSPQITQSMGLGAAFQELGLSAEIASGGLTNILLTAAKESGPFAAQMGLSTKAIEDLINTDPNEFLLKLAESLRGLPADQVAKRLDDMGIKSQEATKVMSLLKDQTDLVRTRQLQANDAFEKGTSLTDEFNKKNNNAAAELAKMGKEVQTMSVSLGTGLLPIVLTVGQAVIGFGRAIGAIPAFLKENKAELALLAIALLTFNGNLIAATAASLGHAVAEKARTAWTTAGTVAQNLLNTAMKMNPIGLVVTAVALLAAGFVSLYNRSETFRLIVGKVWDALKAFGAAVGPILSVPLAMIGSIAKSVGSVLGVASDDAKKATATALGDHKTALATKKKDNDTANADDKKAHANLLGGKATATAEAQKADKAANKKLQEDIKKDNEDAVKDIVKHKRDAQIVAETDELKRSRLIIEYEYQDQLAAIRKSLASNELKKQQEVEAKKRYDTQMAKVDTDAAAREEKLRKERVEKEKDTTDRIIKNERDATEALHKFEETALRQLETNNSGFTLRERAELSRKVMDFAKARALFEYNTAVSNANDIATRELARENLTDAEKKSIHAKRDASLRLLNQKYLADDAKVNTDHTDRLRKNEEEELKKKQQRNKDFSTGFQALLKGDVATAIELMRGQSAAEKTEQQKRRTAFATDLEQKAQMGTAAVNFLMDLSKKRTEREIANANKERDDKIKALKTQLDKGLIDKKSYDAAVEKANEEARSKERAAKEKQWKDQQKADIAMAIINGLVGATKAFAQGGIFGAIGAAIVLVSTGISVAKIKSTPMPTFQYGGVVQGSKHAQIYGEGGISLVDNVTGRNVGEMQGREAIVNDEVTEANMPLMDLMFRRAKTGDRSKPITIRDMVENGVAFRDGGLLSLPYFRRKTYEFGGRVGDRNEEDMAQSESESSTTSAQAGAEGEIDSGEVSNLATESTEASKQMVRLLSDISVQMKENNKRLAALDMLSALQDIVNAANGTTGAVNGTTNAVREEGNNQRGMLSVLARAIK